jgi:Glycosyltransferase family 87
MRTLRASLGILLIMVGVFVSRRAFDTWGADFAPQYMSAWMLREGKNVYNFDVQYYGYMRYVGEVTTWAHFHPPAAAVVALPATLLPYPVARELWFVVAILIMLAGLWRFMAVYIEDWDASYKVLALGLVMCAAATRWEFKVAQPGAIVLGALGLFLTALKFERNWLACLAGGLIASMKVTFGLPFFALALAQRRYKLTAAMICFVGALNLIGLYRMGGPAIIADYKANFAQFERPDQLNYPDPRGFNSLARTDWAYILNAIDPNFARNDMLSMCLSLAALIWLGLLVLATTKERMREDSVMLALTGPLATLSMLAVYHHHYDMGILLLPLIAYVGRAEIRRIPAVWFYAVPVALYVGLFPYEKAAMLAEAIMGPDSVLVVKPLACAVCIVAFVASMRVFQSASRSVAAIK